MDLSLLGGSGNGVRLAAGQTFAIGGGNSQAGIGSIQISSININTTATILALTGKFLIQNLHISGHNTATPVALDITIDGRVIFSGSVSSSVASLSIFGVNQTFTADSVRVDNSMVITAQQAGSTISVTGKIYAEF